MGENAERIQQRINDHIADLPFFFAEKNKDTVSLQTYISRIEQGIEALEWTQENAFTYFKNSLRGDAAQWLIGTLSDLPDLAKTWEVYKPLFREAFGDTTDEIVFAQEIGTLTIGQFDNNLIKYYAAITKAIDLHGDKYRAEVYPIPANLALTAAQTLFVQKAFHDGAHKVHVDLKKEFFIRGLTTKQINMIKLKPNLTTPRDVFNYLRREEDLELKLKTNGQHTNGTGNGASNGNGGPKPTAPAPIKIESAEEQEGSQQAAANYPPRQQSQRGQQRGRGQRGRGSVQPRPSGQPSGSQNGTGNYNGNQQAPKPFFCIFCRKPNHNQDDCRQRIAENAPCLSKNGVPYFPRSQNPVEEETTTQNGSIFANSVFF